MISQLSEHSCLHSFILFFLFNLNCAFTSLYILKLEHAFLILYFLHYIVIKSDDIFQKETFVMNMMLSQHLFSLNYSSCVSQIYISVCNFITLRNSSSFHLYFSVFMFLQSLRVFLCLFYILKDMQRLFFVIFITIFHKYDFEKLQFINVFNHRS